MAEQARRIDGLDMQTDADDEPTGAANHASRDSLFDHAKIDLEGERNFQRCLAFV